MEREEYLVSFLRGCAHAAEEGQLGVDQGVLLVNGDLMNEAADVLEKLLPERTVFRDAVDELQWNIIRAEQHTKQAHAVVCRIGAPKRSLFFKTGLARAQSMLSSLFMQEMGKRP